MLSVRADTFRMAKFDSHRLVHANMLLLLIVDRLNNHDHSWCAPQ